MPIKLYNGRLRISETFIESQELNYYISSYFTNKYNCSKCDYKNLINGKVKVNYGNNIESELTDIFLLSNKSIYNDIEKARLKMKNKRKPTEILVYTDGYSFSAASFYLKYLKQYGGAIIAQYLGNPKKKDEKFDIGQSASPIFTSDIIGIFSKENYKKLKEEYKCELQLPGIQGFYDTNNTNVPLEYQISFPDEQTEIYETFSDETYEKFINKSKSIFEKYKTKCNPDNKKLIKISNECDSKFDNNYTHGGYECKDNGEWGDKCVPSYCDVGYGFDETNKKCIKDICSSKLLLGQQENNQESEEIEEENEEENENENKKEKEKYQKFYQAKKSGNSKLVLCIILPIILFLLSSIMIIILIYKFRYSNVNVNNDQTKTNEEVSDTNWNINIKNKN